MLRVVKLSVEPGPVSPQGRQQHFSQLGVEMLEEVVGQDALTCCFISPDDALEEEE